MKTVDKIFGKFAENLGLTFQILCENHVKSIKIWRVIFVENANDILRKFSKKYERIFLTFYVKFDTFEILLRFLKNL